MAPSWGYYQGDGREKGVARAGNYRGYYGSGDATASLNNIFGRMGDVLNVQANYYWYLFGNLDPAALQIANYYVYQAAGWYFIQDHIGDLLNLDASSIAALARTQYEYDLSQPGTQAYIEVQGIADSRVNDWARLHPLTSGPAGPQGPQGPQGPKGDTGPAGPQGPEAIRWSGPWDRQDTYVVGDVVAFDGSTWLAVGTIRGTQPGNDYRWQLIARHGDLGPQGPQGFPGPPGPQGTDGSPGLVWWGEWRFGVLYGSGDATEYLGSAYIAITSTQNQPPNQSFDWQLIAARGQQGQQGPQGAPGRLIRIEELTAEQLAQIEGPPGPAGPQGAPGINWRVLFNPESVYSPGDALEHNGSAWIATRYTSSEPGTSGSGWQVLAERGEPGPPGPAGGEGPAGPPGPAGTSSVDLTVVVAAIEAALGPIAGLIANPAEWFGQQLGAVLAAGGPALLDEILDAALAG